MERLQLAIRWIRRIGRDNMNADYHMPFELYSPANLHTYQGLAAPRSYGLLRALSPYGFYAHLIQVGANFRFAAHGLYRLTRQRRGNGTQTLWAAASEWGPALNWQPGAAALLQGPRKRATLNDVAAHGPRNGRSTERMESLKAHAGPSGWAQRHSRKPRVALCLFLKLG